MLRTALIVEREADVRQRLSDVLRMAFPGLRMAYAATAREACRLITTFRPELSLVDLALPDGSGVELLPAVRMLGPVSRAMVVAARDDQDSVYSALRAGAQGYVLKHEPCEVLVRQLQALIRGELPLSPSVARMVLASFHTRGGMRRKPSPLSVREREVLVRLADGESPTRIAEQLGLKRNTINTFLKRAYLKLSATSAPQAVAAAMRLGLLEHNDLPQLASRRDAYLYCANVHCGVRRPGG